MQKSLLAKIVCPLDKGTLSIAPGAREEGLHVMEGYLSCDTCGKSYLIRDGIPHLIPGDFSSIGPRELEEVQAKTADRFGFEWRLFKDWGWLESLPDVPGAEEKFRGALFENSQNAFWAKSLFEKKDLGPGCLVLDAGCGNGRTTKVVAETGAEVISIDLGEGVRSAFEHMREMPNVHIVKGNLFSLPFPEKLFDRIFSIGVLMHTGDAEKAFKSIRKALAPEGLFVAHVYGKGMPRYEMIDKYLRMVTTRLSIGNQVRFAKLMAKIARWLRRGGKKRTNLYYRLYPYLTILPTEHHMFDWWSAPVASHHTIEEVCGWFEKESLSIVKTNPPRGNKPMIDANIRNHGAITVLGRAEQ